nr:MAG TPA_asm: hypothetical protein [Caudoviricetes sp.]
MLNNIGFWEILQGVPPLGRGARGRSDLTKKFFLLFWWYFCVLSIGLLMCVNFCNVFQKYTPLCIFMQFVVVLTIVCVCLHIYSIDIVSRVIAFFEGRSFI